MHNPESTLIVERDGGLLVIDRSVRVTAGIKVALLHEGEVMIPRMGKGYVISEDGQRIAGEEMENIVMLGKITYEIIKFYKNNQSV